jgi:hypothetical protein
MFSSAVRLGFCLPLYFSFVLNFPLSGNTDVWVEGDGEHQA